MVAMTEYQALQSNYSLGLTSSAPGETPEIFWTLEIVFFVIYVGLLPIIQCIAIVYVLLYVYYFMIFIIIYMSLYCI